MWGKSMGRYLDPMQDCRSQRIAIMVCVTLVNTQTHTDNFWPIIPLAPTAMLKLGFLKMPFSKTTWLKIEYRQTMASFYVINYLYSRSIAKLTRQDMLCSSQLWIWTLPHVKVSIQISANAACMAVPVDNAQTFAPYVRRLSSKSFYHLRQM